jgi:N-acetylneuraminic acid mutarotase
MKVSATFAGTVAVPDGRIFVISGLAGRRRRLTDAVRVYDPARDSWAEAAPIPTPRTEPGVAVGPDGRIYVVGGGDRDSRYDVVEAYDPRKDAWARLKPLPTPRQGLAAVAAKGADGRVRIYALGGRDPARPGNGLAAVEAYDPAADTWAAVAPMALHRHAHTATRGPDGLVYVTGGTNDKVFATTSVEIYDPGKDAWVRGAPLPHGQECAAAAATPGPAGEVLVLAGCDIRQRPLRSAVAYSPRTGRWRALPPLPTARVGGGAVTVEGKDGCVRVYVLGGTPGAASVEVYSFRPAAFRR